MKRKYSLRAAGMLIAAAVLLTVLAYRRNFDGGLLVLGGLIAGGFIGDLLKDFWDGTWSSVYDWFDPQTLPAQDGFIYASCRGGTIGLLVFKAWRWVVHPVVSFLVVPATAFGFIALLIFLHESSTVS
jgi:hypothetical protein